MKFFNRNRKKFFSRLILLLCLGLGMCSIQHFNEILKLKKIELTGIIISKRRTGNHNAARFSISNSQYPNLTIESYAITANFYNKIKIGSFIKKSSNTLNVAVDGQQLRLAD